MKNSSYSIIDIEVTEEQEIFQLAIINLNNKFEIIEKYNYFIKPKEELSPFLINLTGITNELLKDKPNFKNIAKDVYNNIKDNILVCHGVEQDYMILKNEFLNCDITYEPKYKLDTVMLSKLSFPTINSYKLQDLSYILNLDANYVHNYHQADFDAYITYKLFLKIIEKNNKIPNINYNKIIKVLEHYSSDFKLFYETIKDNTFNIENDNNCYYLVYNKLKKENIKHNKLKEREIYVSSINTYKYYEYNLKDEKFSSFTILKNKEKYIALDLILDLERAIIENKFYGSLYIKILSWIFETKTGLLDELNLDTTEIYLLNKLMNNKNYNKNYYYDYALKKALNSSKVIINYDNLFNVITYKEFSNYKYVFEDKKLLSVQLKRLLSSILHFKEINTEMNIVINVSNDKKLSSIKENINSLVAYIFEMYLSESIELYKEAIVFVLDDMNVILDTLNSYRNKLPKTLNFLAKFKRIISKESGYYNFELLDNYNTLILNYYDIKKEKFIINKINSLNKKYLNKKYNILPKIYADEKYLRSINNDFNKRVLYIFENLKYNELYYINRDKKLNIKYKKYIINSDFEYFFNDLEKYAKFGYIVYATKDILNYEIYLNILFDEIVYFKNLEK